MPEAEVHLLWQALQFEGLYWLVFAAVVAGLVRGFSGFGTNLVFLPFAGQFLPPFWALLTLVIMDLIGPLPNLPQARRDGHPRAVLIMMLGVVCALPLGLFLLRQMNPLLFRYLVSAMAMAVPISLMLGFRLNAGALRPRNLFGTGVCGGFLGGVVGLPGPPVILLYMSSKVAPQIIRANTMMYLFLFDILLLLLFCLQGDLVALPVIIGVLLIFPALIGNIIGGFIFNPQKEKLYRGCAYGIIMAAAFFSLPLWD